MSNTREPSPACPACGTDNAAGPWFVGRQLSSQVWEAVCRACAQPTLAARHRIEELEAALEASQARVAELHKRLSLGASLEAAYHDPTRNPKE